ncbi:hypothetical protein BH09BAC2_BH09BAC2_00400 [soil metagenome]
METDFKNRMYNYEVAPPAAAWNAIEAAISEPAKVITMHKKTGRTTSFFYSLAAAAVVLFMLVNVFFWIQSPSKNNHSLAINNDSSAKTEIPVAHTENGTTSVLKKYVIIENAEGKQVKVSKKVAAIIATPDKSPKKAVFNKKVEEWKTIMLTSTTTSIFDILDATSKSAPLTQEQK